MNLNSDSYSDDELCNLINISYPYQQGDIAKNCQKLKSDILSDSNLDDTDKNQIQRFIDTIQSRLTNALYKGTTEQELLLKPQTSSGINNSETVDESSQKKPMTTYEVTAIGGKVNPIAKNIMIKSVNIDTKFRENYFSTQSSDIQMTLPTTIKNVLAISMRSIELPNTFYSISRNLGNNYFSISSNPSGVSSTKTVLIPDGNYTKDEFVAYFNDIVAPKIGLNNEIIMSIDNTTNKTIISKKNAGSSITDLTLNFGVTEDGSEDKSNPLQMKLGWILGFRHSKYSGSTAYVSEGLYESKPSRYLFLALDDYNNNVNNYFISAFSSSILNNNILCRVSLKEDPFKLNVINSGDMVTKTRNYFGPVNIQKLRIQLLDEYGRVVNLNNMDYSLCLDFTCIYET